MIGGSLSGRESLEFGAIDNEDVGPAIIVKIKNRYAGAGSLNDIFLGILSAKNIHHCKPSFFRNIREVRRGFRRRGSLNAGAIHGDKQRRRQQQG